MIEIRGLKKRFGSVDVLKGVDLELRRGRVTAVVGPNAAGKTTLIKTVLGLTRGDSGTVTVNGVPVDREGNYRRSIGYMPQIAHFPDTLTGADLLSTVSRLRTDATVRDESLIDALAIRGELAKPLRALSGGTRQKINAAVAFLFAPSILILDEPTAGLDPLSSSVLKDRLLAEREHGRTVIITSHVMSELDELADDVAFLVDGRIEFAGTVRDLKRSTGQRNLERSIAHVLRGGIAA